VATPPADVFNDLPLEEVPCPLCGTTAARLLSVQRGRFGVRRCARCGLVRLSPRPAAAAAPLLYADAYYATGGYDDYVATHARFRPLFERFYARRLALLQRHVRGPGRLLEVGCAHGFQLAWLRARGWDARGCELSPGAAHYARRELGVPVEEGTPETVALEPASLDAVYMVDILEHLPDALGALARLRRALKPGGVLLVQCPYELYHWEKLGQAAWEHKKPGTITPDAVPYHLLFFTPRTLKLLLVRAGFRPLARYSGNYGAIRRRLSPPAIRGGSWPETAARFAYFRLGVRAALRGLAVAVKQGSGVIYVAAPR